MSIWDLPDHTFKSRLAFVQDQVCPNSGGFGFDRISGVPLSGYTSQAPRFFARTAPSSIPYPHTDVSSGGTRPKTSNVNAGQGQAGLGQNPGNQYVWDSVIPANEVDSWINALDENRPNQQPNFATNLAGQDVAVAFLVQQQLPRTQIPILMDHPPYG